MDVAALRTWLAEPRTALVAAVAEGVRAHVANLRSRGIEFYGYALLPGEPYDIHGIAAATNSEADIKIPSTADEYGYYRYSVDEWTHLDHDGFSAANKLLVEENERFQSLHSKAADDYWMDEFEVAHSNVLLESVMRGLQTAKESGAFGDIEPFLVVWISDSESEIMARSVQQLNSQTVAQEFLREFG